jgi:hypothetical protein
MERELINAQGYTVEIEGDGAYLKTTAQTFEGIKRVIKNPKLNAESMISIVRRRDSFEIYCGSIQKAQFHFGI